jgi:hypothetical protein
MVEATQEKAGLLPAKNKKEEEKKIKVPRCMSQ